MCLLVLAHRCHPEFPLVVAANRDEFFQRPTAAADFWPDHPHVLAGRDLEQHGTWMGVSKSGRFAALTNVRDPQSLRAVAKSRGLIVSSFLAGEVAAVDFLADLARSCDAYNGFNLILGERNELYYFSSVTGKSQVLTPGIHGLSNHQLDTPWPKVRRAKSGMETALREHLTTLEPQLFTLLTDATAANDADLPDTGVGLEKERWLSPIFIRTPSYGTRCSTVLLSRRDGEIQYVERNYPLDSDSEPNLTRRFNFYAKF